ncbi:MAG: universal stress protein [Gammaproteobacteria bacterium]|nr:universal stress protein [Gammaproteobacteria bacterium]MDE2346245.1 universal stress protein [Gammaproteobacteria bacterium]
MGMYNRILIAVDLTEDSLEVSRRGQALASLCQAKVSFLHVVEFIPVDPAGEALLPPPVDLEGELVQGAHQRLDALCSSLSLEQAPRRIEVGNIKAEIVRVVEEEQADLLVLGSHGRHGLALLLSSTEKSLLHKVPCDVLAVRLG